MAKQFPSPISMRWHLTMEESTSSNQAMTAAIDEHDQSEAEIGCIVHSLPALHPLGPSNTQPPAPGHMAPEHIVLILRQFGYTSVDLLSSASCCVAYTDKYRAVCVGYIKRIQEQMQDVIPKDIYALCVLFYDEPENKHIDLAFNVQRHFQSRAATSPSRSGTALTDSDVMSPVTPMEDADDVRWRLNSRSFTGLEMLNVISAHAPPTLNVLSMCNQWLQLNIVELASYHTLFSGLRLDADDRREPQSFVASDDYKYHFTSRFEFAFQQFLNLPK